MAWVARMAKAPLLPVACWLVGLAVFAMLAIDGLFAGPYPVFVIARVTAYVTAATVAAVTVAVAAMFGLACGAMLTWLGESPDPRQMVLATSRSFWCLAAYVWFGVALLVVDPPAALTVFDMADPDILGRRVNDTAAFAWMAQLRHLALAGFLVMMTWLLACRTKTVNAVLSVTFGTAALAAGMMALGLLAGPAS